MSTVLVFGTFDVLHEGHVNLFEQAREHGDRLVVIVGRDQTVREVKGQFPRRNEDARLATVREHPLVDMALLGKLHDRYRLIEEIHPDCICLGYDQVAFTENLEKILQERGLDTVVRRMEPYKPEAFKSSVIQNRQEPRPPQP